MNRESVCMSPSPSPPAMVGRFEGPSRVALVISSLTGGGAERVFCAVARHFADEGRAVSVVTIGSRATDVYVLPAGVHRIALDRVVPSRHLVEGMVRSAGRAAALRRALVALAPDAVVSFLGRTNVLALLAVAGTGIPVLVCERSDPRHERIGVSWAALRQILYPRAAGVVVQTASAEAWARARARRVYVIPNFVERPPLFASPGARRGARRIVAMGRLEPEKGFDLLVEAFARLAPAHPKWSLHILGEGGERGRLEALAVHLGLGARVHLPGRVADPVPHLASAHVFALPSRYEGIPNALLEAMACGLPVVASDSASGALEVVEDGRTGLLVRSADAVALAAALDRLLSDPEERRRLGECARDAMSRLAPERILPRWSTVLANLKDWSCRM